MKCPSCGAEIANDTPYCNVCGTAISQNNGTPPKPNPTNQDEDSAEKKSVPSGPTKDTNDPSATSIGVHTIEEWQEKKKRQKLEQHNEKASGLESKIGTEKERVESGGGKYDPLKIMENLMEKGKEKKGRDREED